MRNDITEWNWNVDEEEKRKQSKTEMFSDPPWRRPGWKVGEGEGRQKGGGETETLMIAKNQPNQTKYIPCRTSKGKGRACCRLALFSSRIASKGGPGGGGRIPKPAQLQCSVVWCSGNWSGFGERGEEVVLHRVSMWEDLPGLTGGILVECVTGQHFSTACHSYSTA